MNFTEAQAATTDVNITMVLFVIFLFVTNFIFCRYMSIKIVSAGYVRKHPVVKVVNAKGKIKNAVNTKVTTEEFKRLFFFWFVPIIGAFGMIALYMSGATTVFLKRVTPKLFLNHL